MANHLIIGLGGTGGNILRELRRRSFEHFGTNDPKGDTRTEYIYVDSSEEDLNNREGWNYLGEPVHLSNSQKVNIHGMGGGVLNQLQAYPSMQAFISDEDRELFRDDQVSMIIDTGIGGQRRRFGRMLAANNVMTDPQNGFAAVLNDRIINMTNNAAGSGNITFHICAGLAGGTGSGTIVDTIAQLHKIIGPMGNSFDVFLYLYVPEIIVPAKHDAGYYHANGYAALREINAIALGHYHPTDIGGEIDHTTGKIRRLINGQNANPFKQVYLFSDRNEKDYVLPKEEKLPAAVADFLFQRIIASEAANGSRLNRVINCENNPGPAEQDETNTNVRSRNFMTFGITRIVYPETEIKTYAQEKSTAASLTGLLYNKWVKHQGYAFMDDENASIGIDTEISLPETLERLMLAYDYLTLQRPVLNFPGSEDWNNYETYFNNYCTFFYKDIIESEKDHHLWVGKFLDICNVEYSSNFRGLGVNTFFQNWCSDKNVNSYANCIMKHIEKIFFDEWVNGIHGDGHPMSLQKVRLYLMALEQSTSKRIPKVTAMKADLMKEAEGFYHEADQRGNELKVVGFLNKLLFATTKTKFEQYSGLMAKWYAAQAKIRACDFAQLLLTELKGRIHSLCQSLLMLNNLFTEAVNASNKIAENACNAQTAANGHDVQVVEKRFNPSQIRENIESEILTDDQTLVAIAVNSRQQMKQLVIQSGKDNLFQTLYEQMGGNCNPDVPENPEVLMDFVGKNAKPIIADKLIQAGKNDASKQLLGMNILDKIHQDFPTGEALERYLSNLVDRTRCFLKKNGSETAIGQNMSNDYIQLCVPANHPFREEFITAFGKACGGAVFDASCVADNPSPDQIVIIRVASNLLLRYSQNVAFLKDKYDGMVSEVNPKHKLNRALLHTESLDESVMPDLFVEGPEVMRKKMVKLAILIHSVENLVTQATDPATGNPIYVIQIGSLFDGHSYTIGRNVTETAKMLLNDSNLRKTLTKHVNEFVTANYRSDMDKQHLQKLIETMIITVILPMANNNTLDALFMEYRDAAKEIIKNL